MGGRGYKRGSRSTGSSETTGGFQIKKNGTSIDEMNTLKKKRNRRKKKFKH